MYLSTTLEMPLWYLFREAPERPRRSSGGEAYPEKALAETPDEELLICRECRQVITHRKEEISFNGAFRHTFANPHGIIFEIGCFQAVTGCSTVGVLSDDFTWFKGYFWRVLICTGCQAHLGWSFSNRAGVSFYGLILDRLISLV